MGTRAIDVLVTNTRESGVRNLDKQLAKIARNVAKKIALEEEFTPRISRITYVKYYAAHYPRCTKGNGSRCCYGIGVDRNRW